MKKQILSLISFCFIATTSVFQNNAQAQNLAPENLDKLMRATALIYSGDAQKNFYSKGSGTLISASAGVAFVLTNFHVVNDEAAVKIWSDIVLGFSEQQDVAPKMRYSGEVVLKDVQLDLAVIKISKDKSGNNLSANHRFPEPVKIGDSERLRIGENIFAFGFPGVGGNTINFTQGVVNGFVANDGYSSGRDWLKHGANIAPGNSGGGLFNAGGELVAVNTAVLVEQKTSARQPVARPLALGLNLVAGVPNLQFTATVAKSSNTSPATTTRNSAGSNVSGNNSSVAKATSTSDTSGLAKWPPQLELNQNWSVEIQGIGNFSTVFDKRNQDGVPFGTSSGNGQTLQTSFYYVKSYNDVRLEMYESGKPKFTCIFEKNQILGYSFKGYFFETVGNQLKRTEKGCVMRFLGGGSTGAIAQVPGNSGISNTWPLALAVGQTWRVNIDGRGSWVVKLIGQDSEGNYRGVASGTSELYVSVQFDANNSLLMFLLHDGANGFACGNDQTGLQNGTLFGTAMYKAKDAPAQMIGACSISP